MAEAFSAGGIAMAPEWHEYASVFEDETLSTVAGKVKWALLPKGPAGSKNLWGGTGLAVNSYASPDQQRAAWMYITWATSPEVQKRLLLEGSTPTRTSVFEDPEVQEWIQAGNDPLVNMLPLVLDAWKPENIGLAQGKITTWIQVDQAIFTHLSRMLTGSVTPEQAMADAVAEINSINKWPPEGA